MIFRKEQGRSCEFLDFVCAGSTWQRVSGNLPFVLVFKYMKVQVEHKIQNLKNYPLSYA